MPASALVLDFGGVVTRTIFETHRETEAALGLAEGALTWLGPFDPASDPLWESMQNEEISERDYYAIRTRETSDMIDAGWTEMAQFVRAARGTDPSAVIRPEALAAIRTLRAGSNKLAILSNELDLFYGADFRAKLPFLQQFDVICDATYTGILKPDARAYLQCADELGIAPGECVFLDDQARNVRGAEAVGMQAVHFDVTDPGHSYEEAMALFNLQKVTANA